MRPEELLPYDKQATPAEVQLYQRCTGSLLFAAVISRIDIAFAVSRLTRFNLNPSPAHQRAADLVLEYLQGTQFYALELGGGDELEVWSDASFADNTLDRKSSQGYLMKLFGGVVGWRANKQDTVTTSTTEAELLALAEAVKEGMFASRLITELGVKLDRGYIQVWCDNKQTIRLVNEETLKLNTKLRHIDIHNHWLRQAVERHAVAVEHVGTKEMCADGLTKALGVQDFVRFRDMVGIVDVEDRIRAREYKELTEQYLEELEHYFEGDFEQLQSPE